MIWVTDERQARIIPLTVEKGTVLFMNDDMTMVDRIRDTLVPFFCLHSPEGLSRRWERRLRQFLCEPIDPVGPDFSHRNVFVTDFAFGEMQGAFDGHHFPLGEVGGTGLSPFPEDTDGNEFHGLIRTAFLPNAVDRNAEIADGGWLFIDGDRSQIGISGQTANEGNSILVEHDDNSLMGDECMWVC